MKYKCKISVNPTTGDFDDYFFTQGKLYEFKRYAAWTIEMIDDTGSEHMWGINDDVFNKHFELVSDIIIERPPMKIKRIIVPTQIDDSEGYVLTHSIGVVEIRDDVDDDADVMGVHIVDIPLLIKGLEALYDEYMDAQSK